MPSETADGLLSDRAFSSVESPSLIFFNFLKGFYGIEKNNIFYRNIGGRILHRQSLYTIIFSLLLVSIGFFLGQYYAVSRGRLWHLGKIISGTSSFSSPQVIDAGDKKTFNVSMDDKTFIPEKEEGKRLQFPSKVGNLYIDKIISGKEALEHSQQIFGTDAPVKRLFIPYYSNSENQAVVWVFEMNSSYEARQYTEKINLYISDSKTLQDCGSFFIDKVEIYYVKGLNYDNYYYYKNNFIYWISLVTKDPATLFLTFYEYF